MAKLRIGHACTNAYLARFNFKDSPFCRHCVEDEDKDHFIFKCHRNYSQRIFLLEEVSKILNIGTNNITTKILLGAGNYQQEKKWEVTELFKKFLINTGKIKTINKGNYSYKK